jgi:hypothetical protein
MALPVALSLKGCNTGTSYFIATPQRQHRLPEASQASCNGRRSNRAILPVVYVHTHNTFGSKTSTSHPVSSGDGLETRLEERDKRPRNRIPVGALHFFYTMGNVQCGAPAYDDDYEVPLDPKFISKKQSSNSLYFPGTKGITSSKEKDAFLTVHLEDQSMKCILEPKEVNNALMEQAGELIRRERLEKLAKEDDLPSLLNEDDDGSTSGDGSALGEASVTPSEFTFAATEVTSGSAATRPSGNFDKNKRGPKSKFRRDNDQTPRPPKMKGTEFKLTEELDDEIKNALDSATKGKTPSPLATARNRLKAMERRNHGARAGCSILAVPCMFMEDFTQTSYVHSAKKYMQALHLQMKPQCPQFYKNHTSVLDLESPMMQAGSREIPISNGASPPRTKRHGANTWLLDGASPYSSHGDGIEFGGGPPSSPIRLMVTDSPFMDLAVTGSLGLVNRPRSRPLMSSPPRKQLKSPAHYIVLLNRRSGIPLAVCALKAASTGPPVVRIYSTKRRVFGQRPAASTRKLGLDWSESLPLYTWAEIVTEGKHPDAVKYSIFMASGSDGRFEDTPSYRATHHASGSPVVRMVGRTGTERDAPHTGCAVISLSQNEDATGEHGVFFHLSIARGIDPALIICFAAFLDEVVEKAMRLRN